MQLMWFRSDLRTRDNTALAAAMERGQTLAVYLISPTQWQRHDDADCKVDFWLRNLQELSKALSRLHVPLLIRNADTWDMAPDVLLKLCREHRVEALHVNDEYGVNETLRDKAVENAFRAQGLNCHRYLDQILFLPGTVLTKSGGYFQVFSQFRKVCYQRLHQALPAMVRVPHAQHPLPIRGDTVPTHASGFHKPDDALRRLWPAGEQEARRRLDAFVDESIGEYHHLRDFPARPGTSQLSAYLTIGALSPRQCLHAALHANLGEFESGNQGAITWVNELLWREFYKHILVGFPRVSRHQPFRQETEALKWRKAPEDFEAWQQGRTGFPLIDAAMRQLLATGWMHNRLRMVVAMFLTKNLLIDWREGERHFMRHLVDGDLAANNGGWQWSASTGTDAQPWFRIFNPQSQSEKFDADARFIRHWVPEVAERGVKDIHNPSTRRDLFVSDDYPPPIVDLANSRERALAAFKALPKRNV